MAFLKLRCETAYATGAVRTNLGLHDFARKLTRVGLPAKVSGGQVYVKQDAQEWIFGDWEHDGLVKLAGFVSPPRAMWDR